MSNFSYTAGNSIIIVMTILRSTQCGVRSTHLNKFPQNGSQNGIAALSLASDKAALPSWSSFFKHVPTWTLRTRYFEGCVCYASQSREITRDFFFDWFLICVALYVCISGAREKRRFRYRSSVLSSKLPALWFPISSDVSILTLLI